MVTKLKISIISIVLILVYSNTCISQFSFIDKSTYSFKGAQPNFNIVDSSCFYRYGSNVCEKVIVNLSNSTIVPLILPQDFTPLHTITNIYFNKRDTGFMVTKIYNSTVSTQYSYSLYFTKDNGGSWLKLKTDSIYFVVAVNYFDNNFAYFYAYNYKQTNPSQIYDMKKGLFLNDSNTAGQFLKLNEGSGYCLVINSNTNYNGKIATSTNSGKTYQILSNINYNNPPFSISNNGILEKFAIASDSFWIAQYTFDSTALNQISRLYYSMNKGTTWKILFNFDVKNVSVASKSCVYITKQIGPLGDLYQVSNYGNKICKTAFKGSIENMYFWNSDRGLILTADTPNKQPGIWSVTNGGGAPCSITGIKEKITYNDIISLYPNPSRNQITIANYSMVNHSIYQIFNLLGTLVQQGILEEKETKINIKTLASGLYFIKIGDTTLKFVKE